MGNHVLMEKKGYKAYIILNKPEKLNALDGEMYLDILGYLNELDGDPNIRVVILKGNGRAFSAGFDITAEMNMKVNPLEERNGFRDSSNAARWKMWDLSKPVICQVQGYCLGGACELMMPADYVIASDDALIGEPQIQFGAASVFLMVPWLTGIRKGKELMMTGEKINGKEAAECGLITRSVPLDQLEAEVDVLADKLIKMPPEILYIQKLGVNRQFEIMGLRAGLDTWVDMSMFFRFFKTEEIETFSRISAEQGVKAALKWRDDYFASHQE
jgi:enoyl-CoA hydratase